MGRKNQQATPYRYPDSMYLALGQAMCYRFVSIEFRYSLQSHRLRNSSSREGPLPPLTTTPIHKGNYIKPILIQILVSTVISNQYRYMCLTPLNLVNTDIYIYIYTDIQYVYTDIKLFEIDIDIGFIIYIKPIQKPHIPLYSN